ncbi:hypothetical protein HOK00_05075 [bacterium]|jgi:thymidylate kinase|nr:hypothetical protein [bacterium]
MDSMIKEQKVIECLSLLKEAKITYCILRDHTQLKTGVDHDVDLYVSLNDFKSFESFILDYFDQDNIKIVKFMDKYDFKSYLIEFNIDNKFEYLKVDAWTKFQWRGMLWLDHNKVENKIITYDTINIVSEDMALAIRLLKDLIFTSQLPQRSIVRVQNEFKYLIDNNKLLKFKNIFYNTEIASLFTQSLIDKDYDALSKFSKRIRWSQIRSIFLTKDLFIYQFKYIVLFFIDQFKYIFNGPGLLIVLMGPDGSGKSSLAEKIKKVYAEKIFNGCDIEYSRPNILPPLNNIFSLFKRKRTKPKVYDLNTNDKVSSFKGSLQILYYTLDFFIGGIVMKLRLSRGKLIIYDRYFYDYIIQSYWDNLSLKMKYMCLSFVKSPNLNIFLDALPHNIVARKPELKIDVIKDQQTRISNLKLKNSVIRIDTNDNMDISANEIFHEIFNHIYNKK